jgi:DNA polymerase-1
VRLKTNTVTVAPTTLSKTHIEQPCSPVYELVQDESTLKGWVSRAYDTGIVAVDIKTDSLNAQLCRLIGISLSTTPGTGCYIPVSHVVTNSYDILTSNAHNTVRGVSFETLITTLQPVLEDLAVLKVGQNVKFDMRVLTRFGIHINPIDDIMLMSYVLYGSVRSHNIDNLAKTYLSYNTPKFRDATVKSQPTLEQVPINKDLHCAAENAEIILRLHRVLKSRLITEHMATVYETIERPLPKIIANMENCGIAVDRAALENLSVNFTKRLSLLEKEIHNLAGQKFDCGSPRELGEVLFSKLKIPGGKKSRSGTWLTHSDIH